MLENSSRKSINPQIYSLLATIGAKGNENVISFRTGPHVKAFADPSNKLLGL